MTREQFKALFEKYFDEVRNYIYYRSGDAELATDIAQDTFLRIWEKKMETKQEHIKGLLFKIAGDFYISSYRKQKSATNFKLRLKPETSAISPEDQIQFEELKLQYEKVLADMPEKQRTVFLMNRIDQLTYVEIASNLGLSVKAIEKRMKQALSLMKENLKN